jgi:putative membrane protein
MTLSVQERERIGRAIRAAEERTSGEIVCVLAETSSNVSMLPVLLATLVALVLPWLLVAFTAMPVDRILTLQILAFLVSLGILCWRPVRVALMPRRARRAVAHRVAMEQFRERGLARKTDRTGILIFVSLAERYARIVADEGISQCVPQARWQTAVDTLIAHARADRVADGFVAAIEICGAELVAHFPRTPGNRDELPDRIYVI